MYLMYYLTECRYAPMGAVDSNSSVTVYQQPPAPPPPLPPSVSFDSYQYPQHHHQQLAAPSSTTLYRSTLRMNASAKLPTSTVKMPSLSMEKPEVVTAAPRSEFWGKRKGLYGTGNFAEKLGININ